MYNSEATYEADVKIGRRQSVSGAAFVNTDYLIHLFPRFIRPFKGKRDCTHYTPNIHGTFWTLKHMDGLAHNLVCSEF